jgi:hypothetical protein
MPDAKEAITALRQLLEQPVQEPVARVIDDGTPEGATEWIPFANRVSPLKTGDLRYTTPPAEPAAWVGLDEDEVEDCARGCANHAELARAIEAKLREKNAPTGDNMTPDEAQPAVPDGRDWSLLEATQESLREHMAEIKRLKAELDVWQRQVLEQGEVIAKLREKNAPTQGETK